MRLYRNDDMTAEQQWFGTQDEANKACGRGAWELVEVPTDKPGLIAFLNALVDPRAQVPAAPAPIAAQASTEPRPFEVSLATDDAFEALPLPRQLHLAAIALENARSRIKP